MRLISLWRLAVATVAALTWTVAVTAEAANPPECLAIEPLDCSSDWFRLLRPVAAYSIVFEFACLEHDLCYRHGAVTYGYSKAKCDDDFLANMDARCRSELKPIDFLTFGLTRLGCHIAKRGAYAAVVRTQIAADAFQDGIDAHRCCRYDEDGIPLPECVG